MYSNRISKYYSKPCHVIECHAISVEVSARKGGKLSWWFPFLKLGLKTEEEASANWLKKGSLWVILRFFVGGHGGEYGVPGLLLQTIWSLYEDSESRV